ncbi:MAG: ComEA family DNA-binding protein [Demequina sp.]|nr:ComEA family DNA-binding protein [Demequina sp.]
MTETDSRWQDSLAAAAARAYEAAHGSAIPETRRGLRLRMTWRQAVAGALCLAILAGGAWWFTRPDAVGAVPLAEASVGPSEDAVGLVVDVSGAVEAPGLVELTMGARVADAIDAAGGASADAVLDDLNLARHLNDGEQIVVPRKGDAEAAEGGGPVNLNRANAEQLEQLPGVGPVLAERIVADREANGPFASVEDLGRVQGVGDAIVGALADLATV